MCQMHSLGILSAYIQAFFGTKGIGIKLHNLDLFLSKSICYGLLSFDKNGSDTSEKLVLFIVVLVKTIKYIAVKTCIFKACYK